MPTLPPAARRFLRDEEAALVTEYGILLVACVLMLTAVLTGYRTRVRPWFDAIGSAVAAIR